MTRRSRRELERALDDLAGDLVEEDGTPPVWSRLVVRTDGDGYVTHPDGEPVPTTAAGDPNPPGDAPVIILDGRYAPAALDDGGDT